MALYTLRSGATAYTIGFIWQSGHGRAAGLARQSSRAVGYDVYCALPAPNDTAIQLGLGQAGSANLRRIKRTVSLAAALACVGGSLHAVVALDKSRSYHCAIRDGEVLAAGDVVDSAANIDIIEQEHNEMAGLDRATHYSLQEFLALISDRLAMPPKAAKVHRVPSNSVIAKRIFALGVPLVAVIVALTYMHHINSQATTQAMAAQDAAARAQTVIRARQQRAQRRILLAQHSHPWAVIVPPGDFSRACRQPFRALRWSIDGWIIRDWLCIAGLGKTTAHYVPGIGAGVSTLAPPLHYRNPGEASLYQQVAEPNSSVHRDESPSTLLDSDQFMIRLYSLLDATGVAKLHFASTRPAPQFYTAPSGTKTALAWSRLDFTIKTDSLPWPIARALGAIPGVRINQFTLVNRQNILHWTLNGVAYVQAQ